MAIAFVTPSFSIAKAAAADRGITRNWMQARYTGSTLRGDDTERKRYARNFAESNANIILPLLLSFPRAIANFYDAELATRRSELSPENLGIFSLVSSNRSRIVTLLGANVISTSDCYAYIRFCAAHTSVYFSLTAPFNVE